MATKTIGTSGRDYSTLAAWASYVNALTLSAPEIGQCFNDSEFTTAAKITFGGWSGDSSTNTVTLTCGTGQSFRNNASILTNALRYNQSNGVGLAANVAYDKTLNVTGNNFIIDGLQIKQANANADITVLMIPAALSSCVIQNCIVQGAVASGKVLVDLWGGSAAINCLFLVTSATGSGCRGTLAFGGASAVTDCTVVSSNSSIEAGLVSQYAGGLIAKNTATAGFSVDCFGAAGAASTNNATDQSSFGGTNYGTAGQVSLVPATEWVAVTSGSENYRLNNGTSVKLKGNGATTGPGNDIAGQTRVVPYTIACWQATNNNITISPSVGTLTITGQTPGVITAKLFVPSAGAAALTGYLFTFNLGVAIATPSAGALAITGQAPVVTVTTSLAVSPTTGSLTLTGQSPIVTLGGSQFAAPSAGALALVGAQPIVTIGAQLFIAPSAGALTLTGQGPVVTVQSNLPVGPSVTENIRALGQVTAIRAIRGVSGITAIDFTPTEGA